MLKTLRNAFKIKDVRNRILFTFMMLIVIRIGSELPIPGVKGSVFQSWLNSKSADGLGFVDAITGGSFSQMSVFALNITPYITSSIIMQLLNSCWTFAESYGIILSAIAGIVHRLVYQPSKLRRWVRFPLPAPKDLNLERFGSFLFVLHWAVILQTGGGNATIEP